MDIIKNRPTVAIITPVFNAEKYIAETLESAISQTYTNIEIICIDDCSTDNSVTIIEEYMKKDERIKLIKLAKNSRTCVARNRGIQDSDAHFILPLDADDKIDPTYIEKALHIMLTKTDIGVVYCKARYFGIVDKSWNLKRYNPRKMPFNNRVFNCALFRKDDWQLYGGYNINMSLGYEDWDLWLHFTKNNRKFYRINEELFFYRKMDFSRSNSAVEHDKLLRMQVKKNHPDLYSLKAVLINSSFGLKYLDMLRKLLISISLKKDRKIVRILGIYAINKVKK